MPVPITMPKFGLTMTEGTVVSWLAREGQRVEKSQTIAEIETEKIVNELIAPEAGVLARVRIEPGQSAEVQQTIAWILKEGESETDIPTEQKNETAPQTTSNASPKQPLAASQSRSKAPSSPSARRLATELGVNIDTVDGTGPGGRITKEDVERAANPIDEPRASARAAPLTEMRRAIVDRVNASNAIPQVTLFAQADASTLKAMRASDKSIAIEDALLFCLGRILPKHPYLNAAFTELGIALNEAVHIGVAVALEQGLLIPVVRDVHTSTLKQIAGQRAALIEKARSRRISAADCSGGTFTVSNLGMYPVDRFGALLNPPQSAILAVGRIADRAVVVEGQITARPILELGLTIDHRVTDGGAAGAFLKDLIDAIENFQPEVQ